MGILSNPHLAVGNGQHLVNAALAVLAALCCIEFFPELDLKPCLQHNIEINPQADGRCFWSCIYIHHASLQEKREWAYAERNNQGFPLAKERQKMEDIHWAQKKMGAG